MDNIILLDLDGVLIKSATWREDDIHEDGYSDFDSTCVKNLNNIIDKTGYNLVLSSSRRENVSIDQMNEYFKRRGVSKSIKAYVPMYDIELRISRRQEIEMFLDEYKPKNYLIIDDDKSLLDASEEIKSNWIQTNSMIGLKEL